LRAVIQSGPAVYPIYIGFAPAKDIAGIAEAPAFTDNTTNAAIATNVLAPPVEAWQRPLIEGSISAIKSTFDNTGRLMPNSVLLARNPQSQQTIAPVQQTVAGTTPTDIWELEILPAAEGQPSPLWILDGQHRIHGLQGSLQKDNPIPFVLLLNEDAPSYSEPRLAEIFAQVTTTAASLDPLHNEWMSFAFKLGKYLDTAPDPAAQRDAMKCTALMCNLAQLDADGTANPFRDRIKFNPKNSPSSFPGGFAYDCIDMQKLLYRTYFSASPATGVAKLSPDAIARQLGRAYWALQNTVKAPQNKTVFFGEKDSTQRIMQDAFFVGVCTRLLQNALPIDWPGLLSSLKFNTANWSFGTWVRSVSGAEQRTSKGIAEKVFRWAFAQGTLPGQADLVDILRGDGAQFDVVIEAIKANNRADPDEEDRRTLTRGASLNLSCIAGVRRRVKVVNEANNIGSIECVDVGASTAAEIVKLDRMRSANGLPLDPTVAPVQYKNPLSVKFLLHLYGGNQAEANLDITWK
jgi:hypothetical protein